MLKDSITTKELILSELPIIFGSIRFPTINCIAPTKIRTKINGTKSVPPNWTRAIVAGKIVAINEPIEGM